MSTSERSRRLRAAVVVVACALVIGACSEPADDTGTSAPPQPATEPVGTAAAPGTDTAVTEAPVETATDATDAPADTRTGAAGTETPADTSADTSAAVTEAPVADDGSVVAAHAGESWFLGEVPASATPADDSLDPIVLGMINQENTPLGSFPEVRAAAEAAAAWVNAELGGVDGRPVEIRSCITSFDVEQSQSCALELQQQGVVALVGGVDVTSNGSYPVIEQNGLAVVGGIPANLVEQRSPNAFFFSGGGAGAAAAFMADAADKGATTVALAYGEFESFEVAARTYGAAVGESLGLDVELIPFSLFATDYLPVLTKAQEVGADAIIVLAADTACVPLMQTAVDLGLDAQLYLTGACAAESILDAAGETAVGPIFNSEGPVSQDDTEGQLYQEAVDRYATEPAGGAGTVGFRGFMNLYALLRELGADGVSSEALIELARSAVDRPSFWGHPYTCDGQQVPGLPALCAPQQILFELPAVGEDPVAATDWIATDELFAAAVG
jgi:branched-chain amino acid transport system substrate-binding protein